MHPFVKIEPIFEKIIRFCTHSSVFAPIHPKMNPLEFCILFIALSQVNNDRVERLGFCLPERSDGWSSAVASDLALKTILNRFPNARHPHQIRTQKRIHFLQYFLSKSQTWYIITHQRAFLCDFMIYKAHALILVRLCDIMNSTINSNLRRSSIYECNL